MRYLGLTGMLLLLAGCRSYAPAPVDWARERAAWGEASAAAPSRLTLADARQCALFLNPEINALRVRHLASSNAALQTGWWDDPEVGVDALRFIRSAPHPWIVDSTLAFTIPINGVPALERKAAEVYAFADACAVVAAERELMAGLERAWCGFENARARHQFLSGRVADVERDGETAKRLAEAGELDAAEALRLQLDAARMRNDLRRGALDIEARRLALLQLMGLHPSAPVTFDGTGDDAAAAAAALAVPSEEALVRHPGVQEKLARLEASEADLRVEIRRQYPNLSVGPALQSEDGATRAGLTFGMTLPLWNRNRKAVAVAEGARLQARVEAVNEWKRLVAGLALAEGTLRLAEENERQCRETELPAAVRSLDATGQLYGAGEADVVALAAARQAFVVAHLNWLDARLALREAQVELSRFTE